MKRTAYVFAMNLLGTVAATPVVVAIAATKVYLFTHTQIDPHTAAQFFSGALSCGIGVTFARTVDTFQGKRL
jgi:hypothetical protein